MNSTYEPEERIEELAERPETEIRKRNWKPLIIFIGIAILLIGIIPARMYIKRFTERSDPNYYLNFQEAGMNYYKKGQFKEAAEEFENAVSRAPDKFETHYALGMTYMSLRRLEPAAKELIEALKIDHEHIPGHYLLGVTFQQMGKLDFAMKEYYIVMRSGKKTPPLFDNVGRIYLAKKGYDKAIYAFKRAIDLDKDYLPAYISLAKAYEAQGKRDMARIEYQKVRKIASTKPELRQFAQVAEKELAEMSRQ